MHHFKILFISSSLIFILGDANADVVCPNRDLHRMEDGRTCKKQCKTVSDCKGRRKSCICDDVCGMSCINPTATCKLQEPFENGDIAGDGRRYGTTITYNCNEGFILNGNKRRTCRSDRKWSGTPPSCNIGSAGCLVPKNHKGTAIPEPIKGKEEYGIGEILPYICRIGYDLSGIAVATCKPDGTWKLSDFQCVPKNCGDPGTIRNGYKSFENKYSFGNRVFFYCDKGYSIEGQNFISCDTEGNWRPKEKPKCQPVHCGLPIAPEHGSVDARHLKKFSYGAEVRYSCEIGYQLVGNALGICNENKTWGELPICEVNDDCDFESLLHPTCNYENNGWSRVLVNDVPENKKGFVIRASHSSNEENEAILQSLDLRLSKLCLSFQYKIRNLIQPDHFTVNNVQSGSREKIWEVNKADRDDKWLSTDVLLPASANDRKVEFAALLTTQDAQVEVDNIVISGDDECVDECDDQPCENGATCLNRIDDYECVCPFGYEGKKCTEMIRCDVPISPEKAFLSSHQTEVPIGEEVTYKCGEGYRIQGQATLKCRSDKTWSAEVPQCVVQICTRASIPSDVHIQPSKPNWIPGHKVTYSCKNDNYELIGTPTATCQSSGQWSNTNVRCQAVPGSLPCPTGYVWDSPYCFKFFKRPATFNEAEEICESEAATLPVIGDEELGIKIHNLMTNAGNRDTYWVGFWDRKKDGKFGWINEPSNRFYFNALNGWTNINKKDCVIARTVSVSGPRNFNTWEAQYCDTRWKFVCMKFDKSVIPFMFHGPDSYFNGLYIAKYGRLNKGYPFYYLLRPRKPGSQVTLYHSEQVNHWGVYAQSSSSTYHAISPATTPLQVGSAWKLSKNPAVQARLTLTAYSRWKGWGNWGPCSLSCGTGHQERRRTCLQPTIDWAYCKGSEKSIMKCNEFDCPLVDNPCLPNPCRNGGSCQQDGQNYTCKCGREWGGDRCTQYDPCKQKPCRNDGVCSVVGNSYSCTCTPRWTGKTCARARNICFFDESLVNSDVVIEGISGEVHEPGSVFQVGCREPGQHLNAVISTMTCRNGGVWAPDYTQFQCS